MSVLNYTVMQSTCNISFTQMAMHTVSVGDVALPNQQALLSGLNCSGSEERLVDCDHDRVGVVPTACPHVTVRCRNNETEEEGMIVQLYITLTSYAVASFPDSSPQALTIA